MWSCRAIEEYPDGTVEYYHETDLNVQCFTSKDNTYRFLAVIFLFVYAIGIPFCGAVILLYNSKAIRYQWVDPDHPDYDAIFSKRKLMVIGRFGFLFKGFEDRDICPYWEVGPIMIRKMVLVFITVFMSNYEPQVGKKIYKKT